MHLRSYQKNSSIVDKHPAIVVNTLMSDGHTYVKQHVLGLRTLSNAD